MRKNILCIDDIQTNLFTIQCVIEDLAGERYEVLTALSAKEGIKVLHERNIDAILLDVMMPEIDGFECARMIRADEKTKDIPIIFVTANKDDETIENCYHVGGDDYINKPFNYTELLSRISFHIKSQEQEKLLNKEKEYVQSILDLQENLILVTDGREQLKVNKAFLDFYKCKSIQDFQDEYTSVSDTFIEEDGYFHLGLVDVGSTWVDTVIKLSEEEDVLIKVALNDKEYIFNLKATYFFEKYIVTLTDITQISQLSLEYKHEASYDTLTQVYNRNMFNRLIGIKMTKAKESNLPLVFIIFDIDFFKKVNDTHGHLVGDDILRSIAKLVKSLTREIDLFARWGGEEFVLTFDVDINKGIEIANNLRKHIETHNFDVVEQITCSFGITEFQHEDTLDSLILRADKALYDAKNSGRNKVSRA